MSSISLIQLREPNSNQTDSETAENNVSHLLDKA